MSSSDAGFVAALEEAQQGYAEGGIPVGAAIVGRDGEIIARGRNTRVQDGSAIKHGETAAFENAKHLPYSAFYGSTLYTTLSPCPMCAGAMVLFKVKRVIIAENKNMSGREDYLRQHGIEVVILGNKEAEDLMTKFIRERPDIWDRDFADQ